MIAKEADIFLLGKLGVKGDVYSVCVIFPKDAVVKNGRKVQISIFFEYFLALRFFLLRIQNMSCANHDNGWGK